MSRWPWISFTETRSTPGMILRPSANRLLLLRDGRIIDLTIVDRGCPLVQAMGNADCNGACAEAALAIVSPEGNAIDAAVTIP